MVAKSGSPKGGHPKNPKTEPTRRRPAPPLVGPGLVSRRIVLDAADALLVKAVVEAHEGVAAVFGEERGLLILAAPEDREAELEAMLEDVQALLRARHPK
ncbi:MAG: hypothetical protein HYV09_28085 [Deltaproteobacteria bacterium]|nr:hypothetical protein [Deltaproteobacteria bacterium]